MGRWLLLALVVVAAWYGWTQHDRWRARGGDELVFRNRTGATLERMRVSVHGHAWAIERLAPDTTVRLVVRSEEDGPFQLEWRVAGIDRESSWRGGTYTHGPLRMRHRFELTPGEGVVWTSERLESRTDAKP
ncbi:MAG: hypothetical protein RL721_574 [Candidatus Eisenbacteria bacterium]|jgi:hypothetical protein